MTSVATSTWEMVFWEEEGRTCVAVRGPETVASTAAVPDGSRSFGITFAHGASMPHLPPARLVDTGVVSPHTTAETFVLRGEEWSLPGFESAEQFVGRLVREGILIRDPLVSDIVSGSMPNVSTRSVQRRIAAATGLTHGSIRQIERARHAALLLGEGLRPLDVVHRLEFYDQAHLARSLTRFIGHTATDLRRGRPTDNPLSLLYKTQDHLDS